MSCDELKELILEYTVGGLDQREKTRVESHLNECGECNRFFMQSNRVWELLDEWDVVEPKKNIATEFWKRVSEEDSRVKGLFGHFKSLNLNWSYWVALAAILIVSFVSFNLFEYRQTNVVFTEVDRADEELLIQVDRAISKETAKSLEIYGTWDEIAVEKDKGG